MFSCQCGHADEVSQQRKQAAQVRPQGSSEAQASLLEPALEEEAWEISVDEEMSTPFKDFELPAGSSRSGAAALQGVSCLLQLGLTLFAALATLTKDVETSFIHEAVLLMQSSLRLTQSICRCMAAKDLASLMHDGMHCSADVDQAGQDLHGAMQRWQEEMVARSRQQPPLSAEEQSAAGPELSLPAQQLSTSSDSLAHRLIGAHGALCGQGWP